MEEEQFKQRKPNTRPTCLEIKYGKRQGKVAVRDFSTARIPPGKSGKTPLRPHIET
jgi:hypothetical protein